MAGKQSLTPIKLQTAKFFGVLFACLAAMCFASATASALPERFFGMMAHESMNDSEPDWDALQKAGVQRFRMEIKWKVVEDRPGNNWNDKDPFAWEETYDRYFKKAAQHGIEILPYLYTRKDGNTAYYISGGADYPEWISFVKYVVGRYGQNGWFWKANSGLPQYPVKAWEVWNEPNLPMNCPESKCSGATYGQFLNGTSEAIHDAQPGYSPTVLFGGLYQERWDPNMNDCEKHWCMVDYLKNAASVGVGSHYDGLSIHPYALGMSGQAARNYPEKAAGVPSNISGARSAQSAAGLGTKPLWVTEVGWPVAGEGAQSVSEGEQAGLLNETYNWLKANWSTYDVKYAAWYLYSDVNNPSWKYNAGLRTSDGSFRPSWYAYQQQAGQARWPLSSTRPGAVNFGTNLDAPKQSIFYRNSDNYIWEWYWGGTGWSNGKLVSGESSANAAPSVINFGKNPDNPKQAVFYRGSTGHIWEWYWSGSGASNGNLGGQQVAENTSPAALVFGSNMDSPRHSIFYTGTDNQIWQWYLNGSGAWSNGQMTSIPASPNTSPSAFNFGTNPDVPKQAVFYRNKDGNMAEWYWSGTGASNGNLPAGQAVMANTSPSALVFGSNMENPKHSVFYTGANGQIWHYYYSGSGWSNGQVTTVGVAPYTSPAAVNFGTNPDLPKQSVFYAGTNGQIWQWHWNGSSSSNTTLGTGQPIMSSTSPLALVSGSDMNNPKQWVFYIGADGKLWLWYWNGTSWSNGTP